MIDPDGHWPDWGKVWNGVKTVAKVGLEVVKEVSGYNDVANFIREPSWGNLFWAASNFIPGCKLLKGAKYLYKYADDAIGAARKYGDDVVGGARRYGDDLANGARRYGDDLAKAGSRVADFAKSAAKQAAQLAAKKAAAEAAARAARIAAMAAITKRAKAAIAYAAKHNPLPIQQAALKPRIAAKDLVSSSPNLPARKVSALAENVQDVNKTWDIIKATVVKPGVSVIQTVAEEAVSDFANSQVPGLGDVLSLLGPSKKRGNGAAKDAGHSGRNSAGASCPTPLSRNSFTGDTTVLMADGSRKLIRDLAVGDVVLATDPTTGQTADKKITDVREYLTDASVHQFDVASETGTGKISVSDEHPFWVQGLGWREAQDIRPGYQFLTADNRSATVTGTRTFSGGRLVYNLTVDGLHTYYVGAGGPGKAAAADVLVHNQDLSCGIEGDADTPEPTNDELRADALAIHSAIREGKSEVGGNIAFNRTTVAVGVLDGEKVYTVNRNKTSPTMRAKADELGYRRVNGKRLTAPNQTDAEQIMLNAVDAGELGDSGRVAPSRYACGEKRQNCSARFDDYSNINLIDYQPS